jgi:hypothetical protein
MKKILIIVALLVLICLGAYLLINKTQLISNSTLNTYTHSTGGFLFKYPAGITVVENKEQNTTFIFNSSEPTKPVAAISVLYFPKYISSRISESSKNLDYAIKYGTLDIYKTYEISSKTTGSSVLIVSLESSDDPSYFMIISRLSNTVNLSDEEYSSIVKSISISQSMLGKLKELVTANTNMAVADSRQKGTEAKLKATLASVRPGAEMYYDLFNSYSGICMPTTTGQAEKQLKDAFKILTDEVGINNVNCSAKKDAYAVSVKLPLSDIWCVDSTGYIGPIVAVLTNKYSCK